MRSAIHSLLIISFAGGAAAGCVDETASPVGLQATDQPLQNKGVYYLRATGTAESPTFTFYDQGEVAIGDGQVSQNPQRTEIQWRGNTWERTSGAFNENGAVVGPDGADAGQLDTALTVFELSLDQAFPSSSSPSDRVQANSCRHVACRRPVDRCTGACTGFVCSHTDGTQGICVDPTPQPDPQPTPEPKRT